jgi:hypothetical protein
MITEKNHKLLIFQLFVTDCTKKGLASMNLPNAILRLSYHMTNYLYVHAW